MTPEQAKRFDDHFAVVEGMNDKLTNIETLLIGDGKFIKEGLAQEVERHANKIQEFSDDKTKIIAGATVGGTIFGGIFGFLATFFNK